MEIKDSYRKMREANKKKEEQLTKKIMEGNDLLKDTLKKIKKEMEKKSIQSKVNYDTINNNKQENENNNNVLIEESENEDNNNNQNINFQVQYAKDNNINININNENNIENNDNNNINNNNNDIMEKINTNSEQFVSEQQFPILSEKEMIIQNQNIDNPRQTFNFNPNTNDNKNNQNENINNHKEKVMKNSFSQENNKINKKKILNNHSNNTQQKPQMNSTTHMPEHSDQYLKNNEKKINKVNVKNSELTDKITNSNSNMNNQTKSTKIIEPIEIQNNNIINNEESNLENKIIPNNNEKLVMQNQKNQINIINTQNSINHINDNFNHTNNSISNYANTSQQGFSNTNNYSISNNTHSDFYYFKNDKNTTSNFYGYDKISQNESGNNFYNDKNSQSGNNFYYDKNSQSGNNFYNEKTSSGNNFYNEKTSSGNNFYNEKVSEKDSYYPPTNKRFYIPPNQQSRRESEYYGTNKNLNNSNTKSNQSTGNNFNKNYDFENQYEVNNKIVKGNNKISNINYKNEETFSNRKPTSDYNNTNSFQYHEEKIINANKEIQDLRNQIDDLKKEKNYIEKSIKNTPIPLGYVPNYEKLRKQAENKNKKKINYQKKKKFNFETDDYEFYKIYEKKILDQLGNADIYNDEVITKDILQDIVDKCLKKSYYVYNNRKCNNCSRLLEKGIFTKNCPKSHHYFKYGMNSSKK